MLVHFGRLFCPSRQWYSLADDDRYTLADCEWHSLADALWYIIARLMTLLVCLGLGIGKLLSEDKPFWVGLAGLIAAPLAFTAAQAVQRTVSELVSSIASAPVTPALIALGALRGVEYMCLGAVLAILAQRKSRPGAYLAGGLVVGMIFGAIVLALTPAITRSVAGLLGWGVNELLFPMGCAVILYGAGVINRAARLRYATEAAA